MARASSFSVSPRTSLLAIASAMALSLAAARAEAAVIEIPYAGGKQSGSVVVTRAAMQAGDTVKIGGLRVFFNSASGTLPAVCGAKQTIVAQFAGSFASFHQTADTSADWGAYDAYPESGLVRVDSIDGWRMSGTAAPLRAQGYPLFAAGGNSRCEGEEYVASPRWNRIVFARMGSGIDYRAKVSFRVLDDTTYVGPPSSTTYQVLRAVRFDYVLNANSKDLGGSVSLRPHRAARADIRFGEGLAHDLYNPLGVKLQRAPGRFEAAVPSRR